MINLIGLDNVRIFSQATVFDIPKLCVVCGTNSSGKSTILKSLLLLRQSQGINETSQRGQGLLRFVGSQTDFGNYSTMVSHRETERKISFSINVPSTMTKRQYRWLKFGIVKNVPMEKSLDEQLSSFSPFVSATLKFMGVTAKIGALDDNSITDGYSPRTSASDIQGILYEADFRIMNADEVILAWKVQLNKEYDETTKGPNYNITMPYEYFSKIGGKKLMQFEYAADKKNIKLTTFLDALLPSQLISQMAKKTTKSEKEQWSVFPLPPHIDTAISDIKDALRAIHYIAPLRAPGKRYYVTNYDLMPNLDSNGDFLPYLLSQERQPEVIVVLPGESTITSTKLFTALDAWIHYLRTGEKKVSNPQEVRVSSMKGVLVELEVPTPNGQDSYSLVDSGFGYSQILPILVRGLMAEQGSTLIVEQPELHLNPALQVRLADFFVALVLANKQVILETHSEHIVNSMRVTVAENQGDDLSNISKIFYLECNAGGVKTYEMSIQPDGTIQDWPFEFFGEAATLSARLLRAQKAFRMQNKKEICA